MEYAIRLYRDGDARALTALALAAIREVGPHGYAPEQVEAWAARHPGPAMYRRRASDGHAIFVAVDGHGVPVAYAVMEPDGHLDRLYNHPQHTRLGLAGRLLAAAEKHARALGLSRLYTEASELARPSFARAGYVVTHRRDFEIDGVPIHNYAMEKRLG
ncbi:GNAT family N-acetyltransferase [Erythrobacter sp. SDW2]|uniref:GNAT family N-acetyltransferase n=1 Tax=Erythrobacter sp. SDW2 TaxID=2907154 RepID=UPI001F48603B|nr:GNAT family N-acetyltransferase [Erythrobacter sp. SDW2]UIP05853.1 GNAT family N-acetyltransferase [Erythrobacter sp. SDW2]